VGKYHASSISTLVKSKWAHKPCIEKYWLAKVRGKRKWTHTEVVVHRNTRDIYPPRIRCSLKGNSSWERGHPFISFCSSRSHTLRGVGHQSSPDLRLDSVLPPFRNFHDFTPGFKRRIGFGIYLLLSHSLTRSTAPPPAPHLQLRPRYIPYQYRPTGHCGIPVICPGKPAVRLDIPIKGYECVRCCKS
jgi:hypothetical protein